MNLTSIYNIADVNAVSIITANVLFVLLFVFTPAITASITSGASIGFVGSTFIGAATALTQRFARYIHPRQLPGLKRFRK